MGETTEDSQPSSKRRQFQFHLSTLVVLTLVAGGLLWVNLCPRRETVVHLGIEGERSKTGFPFSIEERFRFGCLTLVGSYVDPDEFERSFCNDENVTRYHHENSETLVLIQRDAWFAVANFGVCLTILLALAIIMEWRIRRMERRRSSAQVLVTR